MILLHIATGRWFYVLRVTLWSVDLLQMPCEFGMVLPAFMARPEYLHLNVQVTDLHAYQASDYSYWFAHLLALTT